MKREPSRLAAIALSACVLGCSSSDGAEVQSDFSGPPASAPLAGLVDPFIGTSGDGMTFPGAVVPWGMASPSPHTTLTMPADALSGLFVNGGYRHGAPRIHGFGLTHLSGVGCPDLGVPVIAPSTGSVPLGFDDYGASYEREVAYAGYYGVALAEAAVLAEVTATARTALLRFRFRDGKAANIVLDAARGVSWRRSQGRIDSVSNDEITGSAGFGGFCAQAGRGRVYFVARVDQSADSSGLVLSGELSDVRRADGDVMAYLRYERPPTTPVTMRVGISFVSVDAARSNLDAEERSFDAARDGAALAWQAELGRIEVQGGTASDHVRFYTALYHSLIHPNLVNDVDGTYPRFSSDGVGNADGEPRFTVFSLWDTYRTVHPLLALVYPEVQMAIVRSIEDMTLDAAAPPKWELIGDEVQMMVGDPANIVVADSFAKGLRDFDVEAVYDAMYAAAERGSHRPGNDSYRELGYVPMESAGTVWGPVSTTLEYAFADWALAKLADALGRHEDAEALQSRAASYSVFFDDDTGTLRPRNANGSFLEPFDPDAETTPGEIRLGGPGYVEGTAWQYAFFAPHDVPGLVTLHGSEAFIERLQHLFDTDRFVMWNEPDLHYPYLFTFVEGAAPRTQREVRRAMSRYFGAAPDGLPGNDDAGALSAWFVFSAMGFYPVTPGEAEYRLGSPLFEQIVIHLTKGFHEGDTFVIEAHGNRGSTVLAQSMVLNGRTLEAPVLSHQAIVQGGILSFAMAAP